MDNRELCTQQHTLYQELYALAKQQHILCAEGDFSQPVFEQDLAELLRKRREIMGKIDTMADHIADSCRLAYADRIGDTLSLAKRIHSLDQQSQQAYGAKVDEVRNQVRRVRQGRTTHKAYNPNRLQGEGVFIDRRSR